MTNPTVIGPAGSPAATPKLSPRENEYAHIWADFVRNTKDHVLTVQQDDGLNRRMRVGAPDSGIYSWTVVTWPGYLQTVGDIADGYGFRRLDDMIAFFAGGLRWEHSDGAPSIDFNYWAEKLTGGRSHEVKVYSDKTFLQSVTERLEEHEELGTEAQALHDKTIEITKRVLARHAVDYDEYLVEFRKNGLVGIMKRYGGLEVDPNNEEESEYFEQEIAERSPAERRAEIISDARWHSESEHEAYQWLQSREDLFGPDVYEIGLRDFDYHFVLACYAIALTVKLWREYEQLEETKRTRALDDYVWVEGGLVQNSPSLPVFDLDVLDADHPTAADAEEALDLYERLVAHPKARIGMARAVADAAAFVRAHGYAESVDIINEHEAERLGTTTKE